MNGSQLSPASGQNFPVIGDLSRPSSANRNNCDDETNVCGCVDDAKQNPVTLNGDRSRHIETSTDTLVADVDVEERLRGRSSTLVAQDATMTRQDNVGDATTKEPHCLRIDTSEKCAAGGNRKCKVNAAAGNSCNGGGLSRPLLQLSNGGSRLPRPWEVPAAAQERADAYFKNRCDSDGLPVHQTEAQRRLVAIYFTHQEQVRIQTLFKRLSTLKVG